MTAPAEAPEIMSLPLADIVLGKNYRHRHGKDEDKKIAEIGESMKQHGQLEPVLVRPAAKKGTYELVFGGRRYRAAKVAKLEHLLATVREIADDDVLEIQLVENNQRLDPHPLDEAEGFAELVKRGRTPAQIAERLGRDVGYVAKRLVLCKLSKKCQKALDEEKITFGVALLLARMPSEKLQDEALNDIEANQYDGLVSVDDARRIIEEHHMLSLADAPFDTNDAELVPKAGPCATCPKRTGVQRELFDDIKSKDLCTDKACFDSKVDALWQIRKKEAEKGGKTVLEGKAAQNALRYGGSHVSLDQEEWDGKKQVKVRKLFGNDLPETTLARSHDGKVLELVPRADFNKMMREKHPKEAREERRSGGDSYAAQQKREEKKQRIRRKAIRAAITEAVENVKAAPRAKVVELVVRAFAARAWNEVQRDVLERRGVTARAGNVEAAIVKLAKDMKSETDVLGLGLELALRAGAPWHTYGGTGGGTREIWGEGLKLVSVKFDKHERAAQAEAKENKGRKPSTIVHLFIADGTNGTACGGRLRGKESTNKSLLHVTCENCKRVGPGVLRDRMPARKAKRAAKPKSGGHHWAPNGRNACGGKVTTSVGSGASSHFSNSVTCAACIAFHATERGQKLATDQEKKTAAARARHVPKRAKKARRK